MLQTIVYGFIWCFAVYGILVMIQEIMRSTSYKKIEENVKLVITVKDVEEGIENYIREILCERNLYNDLIIIDLDSNDDTFCILKELEKENENLKVLNKREGADYLHNLTF